MTVMVNMDDRGCVMYNQLKSQNIIIDLEALVKSAEEFDEITSSYAEFMRERILSVSGMN